MRQRLSFLPRKRARQVGHLKVFIGLRLVFAGFEIEEAERGMASEPESRKHGEGMSSSAISLARRASESVSLALADVGIVLAIVMAAEMPSCDNGTNGGSTRRS